MHPMSCTCPSCQAARAGEFEFEFESFEGGETSEQEELELAMELLSVQTNMRWSNSLEAAEGHRSWLKPSGGSHCRLKSLAKVALPIAGTALGSFIPIPGVVP